MFTAFQISRGKRCKYNFDSRKIGIITTTGHIQEKEDDNMVGMKIILIVEVASEPGLGENMKASDMCNTEGIAFQICETTCKGMY